ncbi:prephenate dehydratase [Desulfoferula mesophila]|uniref:Bifunctional chorismate mutase/prephenate dehydratase n=1 Tax=Desulfoferula mesophila TaxID=3058419 RepID=A0AAU9EUQ4_9BACT|nr:P-protein [Desulfoferula mesophilus]
MNSAPSQIQPPSDQAQTAINALREEIDQVDRELMSLLNQRARLALDIGRLKKNAGLPVFVPERESDLLDKLAQGNHGPLPNRYLVSVFREVISACRSVQQPLKVAFLGPEFTFSHQAAVQHFGSSCGMAPQSGIAEVFREVESGRCQVGLVPVENSGEGAVGASLDQFMTTQLKVCGEVYTPINHVLMSQGDDLDAITTVYSHPQALAQCRGWLTRNLPQARVAEAPSTAAAARQAAETPGSAAIGAVAAARHHCLKVLAEGIQDYTYNTTRFLVIGKQDVPPCGQDKTSIVFLTAHRPGSLYKALGELAELGVNLSRIESRPTKDRPWEYAFFVDLNGHRQDPEVAQALAALESQVERLRVLGSFPAGEMLS